VKVLLRTLAVTAIVILAPGVCFGAKGGGSVIKKHESLIDKKRLAATRPARPLAKGGARLRAASLDSALRAATAAGGQKAGTGACGAATRNASIAGVTLAPPATAISRVPAVRMTPRPGAANPNAGLNGTGIKHSMSALTMLGGPSMGKGTASLNGTTAQPKKH
jgi:hypothetical protein